MSESILSYKNKSESKTESGATMIEYALMACLIALVAVTGVAVVGKKTNVAYGKITNAEAAAINH